MAAAAGELAPETGVDATDSTCRTWASPFFAGFVGVVQASLSLVAATTGGLRAARSPAADPGTGPPAPFCPTPLPAFPASVRRTSCSSSLSKTSAGGRARGDVVKGRTRLSARLADRLAASACAEPAHAVAGRTGPSPALRCACKAASRACSQTSHARGDAARSRSTRASCLIRMCRLPSRMQPVTPRRSSILAAGSVRPSL